MNPWVEIHSYGRWLLLGLGFLGVVFSFLQTSNPSRRALSDPTNLIFLAVLDAQWLLGMVLAVAGRSPSPGIILHGGVMTLAVALAHVLKRLCQRSENPGRLLIYRFLTPILLILAGHILLVRAA